MGSMTGQLLSQSAQQTSQLQDDTKAQQQKNNQAVAAVAQNKANKAAQAASGSNTGTTGGSTDAASKAAQTSAANRASKMSGLAGVIGSMHDGGTAKKSGKYLLHEGEHVVPARASDYRRVFLKRRAPKA